MVGNKKYYVVTLIGREEPLNDTNGTQKTLVWEGCRVHFQGQMRVVQGGSADKLKLNSKFSLGSL